MYAMFPLMYAICHVMYAAYMTTNLPLHDVWQGKHSALSEFYCCILYLYAWCMLVDKLLKKISSKTDMGGSLFKFFKFDLMYAQT